MGYLIGLVVFTVGAMLLRRYLHSRPIPFTHEGMAYVRLSDGRFATRDGTPVDGRHMEAVKAHWEGMANRRSDQMSWVQARN